MICKDDVYFWVFLASVAAIITLGFWAAGAFASTGSATEHPPVQATAPRARARGGV